MTYGVTIDATGISAPTYAEILAGFTAGTQSIFGSDIDLDPDSQDGQQLAIFAAAVNDCNQGAINGYLSFRPAFAQGAGLASLVNLNGIAKKAASYSTVSVTLTGVNGTPVNNGVVSDVLGNSWDLPSSVTIGGGGTVTVTATAQKLGAIAAGIGTVTDIGTPTRGWQSVTNAAIAVPGAPVESDAQLRARQKDSVAFPASTVVAAISAAVGNVPGVSRYFVYENDTDMPDADGIPAHSISVVAQGGNSQAIADAIASRKPPGIQTYGTTSETTFDSRGVPSIINFYTLTDVPLEVEIDITALAGYVTPTGAVIEQAVADFISSLALGEDSYLTRLFSPANLGGVGLGATFHVTAIRQSRSGPPAAADVAIAFNEAASCTIGDIALTVT